MKEGVSLLNLIEMLQDRPFQSKEDGENDPLLGTLI
jgi:hypothetical protein